MRCYHPGALPPIPPLSGRWRPTDSCRCGRWTLADPLQALRRLLRAATPLHRRLAAAAANRQLRGHLQGVQQVQPLPGVPLAGVPGALSGPVKPLSAAAAVETVEISATGLLLTAGRWGLLPVQVPMEV